MINCITIDDEPLALSQLAGYISRIPFLNLVASCQDAFEAMKILSTKKVDLMFVDINMPDLNGIDFVHSLTEKPMVIFTTAYSEYAVDGFKMDAIDYLLKPFAFQDFLKGVNKAYKWWATQKENNNRDLLPSPIDASAKYSDGTLFIKSDYRSTRITLDDVKYIEGMSEYVRIFIEGEEKPVMPLLSMKRIMDTLPPQQFMRVHRSYIVNLNKVTEVSRLRIVFGETFIPIGENYKERFMEYINSRMMR
ncbi:MAG: LytTR family DNA-binding domain-containing protein [Prevotellaceae bacterium]|jgi:two-component system LytT family response regulator|nr:LytTR family DNA-binding domain-containing protein [Prevotellaceae bacterium]